jgi:hypothetical protein
LIHPHNFLMCAATTKNTEVKEVPGLEGLGVYALHSSRVG